MYADKSLTFGFTVLQEDVLIPNLHRQIELDSVLRFGAYLKHEPISTLVLYNNPVNLLQTEMLSDATVSGKS